MIFFLNNITSHVFPQSIEEILKYLKDKNSQILAGGTDLSLNVNQNTTTLIDIHQLPLRYIKETPEGYLIGSLTSAYDIYSSNILPQSLRKAAFAVADRPLSHAVTIGGNLAKIYPWCDLPPILWALQAKFTIYDAIGNFREFSADEFFAYAKEQNVANRNTFIKEIFIPKQPKNSFSQYQKFGLTEIDRGQVNIASFLSWDDNHIITDVRLVVSAITKSIQRLEDIEKKIIRKKISNVLIRECKESVIKTIEIIPNYKSSIEFRSQILQTFLERTLQACMEVQK